MRADYEDHCRCDACEHFAPAPLLTLHRPLGASATASVAPPAEATAQPRPLPRPPAFAKPTLPLVTAIMPNRERPKFGLQAVRYFCAQDYPNKELVVLEDGSPSLAGRLPDDPRIRHVATGVAPRSIGAMHNSCEKSAGALTV